MKFGSRITSLVFNTYYTISSSSYFSEKVNGQSIFELRDQIKEMETTRNFTIWHDHADINRQSYYLITVSFLYDTAVYKTAEECG